MNQNPLKPSKVQQISLLNIARIKLAQLRLAFAQAKNESEELLLHDEIEEVKQKIADMAFCPKMQVMNGQQSKSNCIINGMI